MGHSFRRNFGVCTCPAALNGENRVFMSSERWQTLCMIKKIMVKVVILAGAVYCAGTIFHFGSRPDPDKAVQNFLCGKSDVLGGLDML